MACSISDGESAVITGGEGSNEVFRFQIQSGNVAFLEMPDLLSPRNSHGCGSYVNDDNEKAN